MGVPFVILASGQSNMQAEVPYSWSPSSRAKLWNQTPEVDSSTGTTFSAFSGSKIGVARAYANRVALADPNKDVYLINLSKGGMDLSHWVPGVVFNYNSTIGGTPANGELRRGNSTTPINQILVSNRDAFGDGAFSANMGLHVPPNTKIVLQSNGDRTYTTTAAPTNMGSYVSIPVQYQSGGGFFGSMATMNYSPNFNAAIKNVVPAALAAIGASKIDMFLWWQGESDAIADYLDARYKDKFDFFMDDMNSNSWFPSTTPLLFFGISSNALSGQAHFDRMNTTLQQIVALAPSLRKFSNNLALPSSVWSDGVHMTAAGYKTAADYAFDSVYAPALVDELPPPTETAIWNIRNAANSGWLDLTQVDGLYVRNADNTDWLDINAGEAELSVRDASDDNWIAYSPTGEGIPGGGSGEGDVTAVAVTSGWTVAMNFGDNPNHFSNHPVSGGQLYADGPFAPYKGGDGRIYNIAQNQKNWRFDLGTNPANMLNGNTWTLDSSPCFASNRNPLESAYDDSVWLYGKWAEGNTVYCAAHHEWYYTENGQVNHYPNNSSNHFWLWGTKWMKSTDNGRNWAGWPNANSERMIIISKPFEYFRQPMSVHGFYHPSNIVKEGTYYYTMVCALSLRTASGQYCDEGLVLLRTQNLNTPLGWQFWNGSGWTTVNHGTHQEEGGGNEPYIFFQTANLNPYLTIGAGNSGCCIRLHGPTNKWMMFGTRASGPYYSVSATLANPQFQSYGRSNVSRGSTAVGDYGGYHYNSVVDPSYDNSDNQNFMKIGNNPKWWTAAMATGSHAGGTHGAGDQIGWRYANMSITVT